MPLLRAPQNADVAQKDTRSAQTGIWHRLHAGGKMVGYAISQGAELLYSPDGQTWSEEAIDADDYVPQIPLSLPSGRIFHGDHVEMPIHAGAQVWCEKVFLLGEDREAYLYDVRTEELHPLLELWPPPAQPQIRRTLGTFQQEPLRLEKAQNRLATVLRVQTPCLSQVAGLAALIALGLLFAAGLQLLQNGHLGPLKTSLGGLLGSLVYWWALRRADWHALRRFPMLRLSVHAGWVLASASVGLMFFADPTPFLEQTAAVKTLKLVAYGGLGFAAGFISSVIGAELVAWRSGGYAGEPVGIKGFRGLG